MASLSAEPPDREIDEETDEAEAEKEYPQVQESE